MGLVVRLILLILISAACVQAQEEMTVQISTFARRAAFLSEDGSERFLVMEAGEQIAPESSESEQINQIILAIDNSDSMKYLLPDLVDHLEKTLPTQPSVPIMIATFNEKVEVLANFTTSKTTLQKALANISVSHQATKLFAALRTLQEYAKERYTHLIFITDGADTAQEKINIQEILSRSYTTISYVNWGYGDASLPVNEPGYRAAVKSSMVKTNPNSTLTALARASGGDVMNFTDWKPLKRYLQRRLNAGGFIYRLFWHTENPERAFQIISTARQTAQIERYPAF
ncbi:MAG: VWA domain-containing protein [Acidobacteriota bacterium]